MKHKNLKCLSISFLMLIAGVVMTKSFAQDNGSFVTMKVGQELIGQVVYMYIAKDNVGDLSVDITDLKVEGIELSPATMHASGFDCKILSTDIKIAGEFKYLDCGFIGLTELNIGTNPELATLRCEVNYLKILDVSKNPALIDLVCNRNQIEALDVSACKNLIQLDCGDNRLKNIDLSKNVKLTAFYCMNNQIEKLNFVGLKELTLLSCPNNQLTDIEIGQNDKLVYFSLFGNKISGEKMSVIIDRLPNTEKTKNIVVIDSKDSNEKNVCYKDDVKKANAKKWAVYDRIGQDNSYGVLYEGSEPTDIENITLSNVSYYPNPAKEYVIVQTTPNKQVSITTIDGKVCFDSVADINGKCYINLASLSSGVYFIKTDHGVEKLIIE